LPAPALHRALHEALFFREKAGTGFDAPRIRLRDAHGGFGDQTPEWAGLAG
jgi:hypothetical protein